MKRAVVYTTDHVFGQECAGVLKTLAWELGMSLETDLYCGEKEMMEDLHHSREQWELVLLDVSGGIGIHIARKLRRNGYTGGIVFLAEQEDYVLESMETEPLAYIRRSMIHSRRFENIVRGLEEKEGNRKENTIPCERNGVCLEEIMDQFDEFSDEAGIKGVTRGQECQVCLDWEKLENLAEHSGFFKAGDKRLIHVRTIRRIEDSRQIWTDRECIAVTGEQADQASRLLYQYLSDNEEVKRNQWKQD